MRVIECSIQNCASILPQLGLRMTVYDRVGGFGGGGRPWLCAMDEYQILENP